MISKTRSKLDSLLADFRAAKSQYRMEQQSLIEAEDDFFSTEEAQKILQLLSKVVQEEAHHRIASVVSRCLEAVFDEPYEFKINFECKRGKTEANLVFVRDGMEIDPMSASGGGVIDVAAFALRLACLMLARPPLRRILVLDEPFRYVSVNYRSRVRDLVLSLSEEMNIQFLLVTHSKDFMMGKVVEIE